MLVIYKFRFEKEDDVEIKCSMSDFSGAVKEMRTLTDAVPISVIKEVHTKDYLNKVSEVFCKDHLLTKDDLCKLYGFKSYDVALPQEWLNDMSRSLAFDTVGEMTSAEAYDMLLTSTVWSYDDSGIFGAPFYLTKEMQDLMDKWEKPS